MLGSKSDTESMLSEQQSLSPILLSLSLLPSPLTPLPPYTISQYGSINFELLA